MAFLFPLLLSTERATRIIAVLFLHYSLIHSVLFISILCRHSQTESFEKKTRKRKFYLNLAELLGQQNAYIIRAVA